MLRKKQEVGGKIGHDEYTYYLGDPNIYTQDAAIRGQGDIQRGGPGQVGPGNLYHKRQSDARPPWGINADDAPRNQRAPAGNNNNYGPLVPAAGMPSQGGGGRQPNSNAPQASPYGPPVVPQDAWPSPSPYSPGQPQPMVTAFSPVVGSNLPPVQPLAGVLPPIYRPKPPLSFQNAPPMMPSASPYYTPSSMAPVYYPGPGGAGPYLNAPLTPRGPYFGAPNEIEMTPTKPSPQSRPTSSPAGFLPPLYGDQDPAGGPPRAGRRRSSGSQIPGLGGGVGGGDDDDGHRAQQDARQRAQQLQDENARLMAEQKRRKEETRRRQLDEDLVEERRLQKEREAVAKRELAEVEREREEKEMKMMGPAAYAAKKRQEEQQKRAQTPSPPVETATSAPASNPPADAAPTSGNGSVSRPQAAPYQQTPLFAPPNAVAPHGSNTSTTSYTFLNQQAPPLSQAMLVGNGSQRTTYSYETDHLKAELRHIADEQRRLERIIAESLRANQATASATLRAVAAQNAGTRVSVGAGTYLTDSITPLSAAARGAGHPSTLAPIVNTHIYRSSLSAESDAQGAGPLPPSSSSWLEAYLKPNAAFPSSVAGTAPPPASTSGLGWASTDQAGSAPSYLGSNNANRYVSGSGGAGISVLASQIHASTADWSASRNRSRDPEDLSYEPSTFVGPVVPSQPLTDADTDGVRRDADAARAVPAPAPASVPTPNPVPAAAMTSPPSFILLETGDAAPGLDSKGGGSPRPGSGSSSILKKGSSPRVGAIPANRAGPPSVRWDEL